jgi:hypothetical protein
VLHDQLAAPIEKVEQRRTTVGALKDVFLLDLDHRQPASVGAQRVACAGQFFLSRQQLLACEEPLLV